MSTDNKINLLQKYIDEANDIVFFGGAGVSTESGIPDFRSANGIFTQNLSAEEIVSHTFFFYNTRNFYEFYKNKMMFLNALPNECHKKLAELEQKGKNITIITQNIDGLHQLAGSKKVIELHGSIHRNYCLKCHSFYDAKFVKESPGIPTCPKCGGLIKPDVVLYGEALDEKNIERAIHSLSKADLLIVAGTSLKVYPAANLIHFYNGKRKVNINLHDNPLDNKYLYIDSKVGEVFKKIKA